MIAATRAWRMRVQRHVAQAIRNMGDPITELQFEIKTPRGGVEGEIDVVSKKCAIEVKTGPNNDKLDRWQAQVTRLAEYAKANGLEAEYWHQNPIHPDRLKFLTDNGVKAFPIP